MCLCVTVSGINCPSSSYLFYLSSLSIQSTDDHPIPSSSPHHDAILYYLPPRQTFHIQPSPLIHSSTTCLEILIQKRTKILDRFRNNKTHRCDYVQKIVAISALPSELHTLSTCPPPVHPPHVPSKFLSSIPPFPPLPLLHLPYCPDLILLLLCGCI